MARWRVAPLPADWPQTVVRILDRDRHICYVCGGPASEVDHVVPASQGGTDDDVNLKAICERDHRSKTGREGRASQGFRKREPESHPGFV